MRLWHEYCCFRAAELGTRRYRGSKPLCRYGALESRYSTCVLPGFLGFLPFKRFYVSVSSERKYASININTIILLVKRISFIRRIFLCCQSNKRMRLTTSRYGNALLHQFRKQMLYVFGYTVAHSYLLCALLVCTSSLHCCIVHTQETIIRISQSVTLCM